MIAGLRDSSARICTAAKPGFAFLAIWTVLDLIENVRYPGYEGRFWYLLPSVDVTCLLAVYAVLAVRHIRVPTVAHVGLVIGFVVVRVLRIADGFELFHFYRQFNLYIDLPLVPELVRLLFSTRSAFVAGLVLLGLALALAATGAIVSLALRVAERSSLVPGNRRLLAVVAGVFVLLSLFHYERNYPERYRGAFAESVVPRLWDEVDFLLNVYGHRTARVAQIEAARREIDGVDANLAQLHHANVLLLLVESYGQVVLDRPSFDVRIEPVYRRLDRTLGDAGFSVVSRILQSPTYGGASWLAHATIATGIRTSDQWQYDLVRATRPKPLEAYLAQAGYDTVLLEPGTTREITGADFHRFGRAYFEWTMSYRGPHFAWATMPDQYVLDFAYRHVLDPAPRPIFLEAVLVSSHAIWDVQPALVDWNDLGDGSIFNRIPPVRYDVDLANVAKGAEGYIRSIEYDFTVLEHFLTSFVRGDALVVVLGDHQPSPAITERSSSWGVPIHVISRSADLVAPFRSHGYTAGMRPDTAAPVVGMETFLADFLRDFSE